MIRSILWWAMLAGVAVVTIGVQMDRQAKRAPAIAATVPEPFRATSQFTVAAYALGDEDPAVALAEAQELVRARPLPAENLRILAQAQTLAGQVDAATLTIQYAAQRGWREPIAQESMLRLALNAGDEAEAARRYAALFLKNQTEDALLLELGSQILASPGGPGRETLATIVGGGERWHRQFLQRSARVMPPDAFLEIIQSTSETGTRYDCTALRQILPGVSQRDAASGDALSELIEAQC